MHLLSALRRSDILRSLTGLWLVAFLLFGPALSAAVRNVPATYPSITAALAASSSGDEIHVAAGTYDEAIEDFPLELKDGVAVSGASPATTTIKPDPGQFAFYNDDTDLGPLTRLEGFTLTHDAGIGDSLMFFGLGTASMSPTITGNEFIGNGEDGDGGIFIRGVSEGGSFDGAISDNLFTGFSGGESSPAAQLVPPEELFQSGGIALAIAPLEIALRKHAGPAAEAVLPGEDNVTPLISGNTFAGNAAGVLVLGTYYSYDYSASGVLSPTIDDNTFEGDIIDVVLAWTGFGAREFSPTITNNESTGSFIGIGDLPIGGPSGLKRGGPAASAVKAAPVKLKDRLTAMANNIAQHRVGTNRPAFAKQMTASAGGRLHANGPVPALPTVSETTISGNTITDSFLAGVLIYQYVYGGAGNDLRKHITQNEVSLDPSGIGLGGILVGSVVTPEDVPIPDAIEIEQNHVTGGSLGIATMLGSCDCSEPPLLSTNASVVIPDPANDVQIIGNILEGNDTGLSVGAQNYSSLATLVSCNVIRNNTTTGALIVDGSDPTPDFGGGSRNSPGKNSLHDNAGVDMRNDDADPVKAENNWWGTTNPATIETNTYDFTEDSAVGDIDFDPPLAAEAADCIVVTGNADLAIVKSVNGAGPYTIGSNITYHLAVTNNGPDAANNVVVTDPLPAGTGFVSASAGCSFAANTITCTVPTLANGASTSFDVTVQAQMQGSVVNTATVDSDESDGTPGNSTSTAPAVPVGAAVATPIPTASEWGLMVMGLMLAMTGLWFTRRIS